MFHISPIDLEKKILALCSQASGEMHVQADAANIQRQYSSQENILPYYQH